MSKRKKSIRILLIVWCVSLGVLTGVALLMAHKIKAGDNSTDFKQEEQEKKTGKATATPIPSPTPSPTPALEEIVFSNERSQLAGNPVEECGGTSSVRYGMRYPEFGVEQLDALVKQDADELLANTMFIFKEEVPDYEKPILILDYDSYQKEQLVSVRYNMTIQNEGEKLEQYFYYNYNLADGTKLSSDSLFKNAWFSILREMILQDLEEAGEPAEVIETAKTAMTADASYFADFMLSEDGITFFLDTMQERSIQVSYEQINSYLKVSLQGVVRSKAVRELDSNKPMIALTFDDGPHWTNTKKVVDLLVEYNARSTFFMVGNRVEELPEVVQYVKDAGQEVASHTYSHKDLANISEEEFWSEIRKANEAIYAAIGETPVYIRPPYGSRNEFVMSNMPLIAVCWNVDSEDWKSRDRDTIVKQVMNDAGDGKIVLMHDIHTFTAEAVELLLPKLIAAGYQLVTVEELFYYKGVEAVPGVVYHSSYN